MKPGELLRYRERLGMTQAQLAELLDVPKDTWSRWERGALELRHGTILRYALRHLLLKVKAKRRRRQE